MITRVDLNSDLGESWGAYTMGNDPAMLEIVSSANVACGFHAGDPVVMANTVALAKANGVALGAHPGFLDLWGFGRRPIHGDSPESLANMIAYQIGALMGMATAGGHAVTHVKTHGSLGNMAAVDATMARAVAEAVMAVDAGLILVVMPGNELDKAARARGLRTANEVYADRTYDDAGNLTPRREPGAVIHDPIEAAERVLAMLQNEVVTSASGRAIPVRIDTICVHGDNPAAVEMARTIRTAIEKAGVAIAPFHTFVP